MKRVPAIFVSFLLTSCLCACNLPQTGTPGGTNSDAVATEVVLTLAAFTQTAQPSPLPSIALITPTDTQASAPSPTWTSTSALTPSMAQTPTASTTPIPKPGAIAGGISGYPYGSVPSLVVVAYKQNSGTYWYLITNPGATSYSMTDSSNKGFVSPGSYQVVAYDASGNTGGCPSIVTVISEQTVNCDITNWGGGYPAKPSGIPNP
jgi:hypothetical protein